MTLKELLGGIEVINCSVSLDTEIQSLCYDSRKAKAGSAFVAIEGFETDGHKYISDALNNGAAVVICGKKQPADIPHVLVQNPRRALAVMSANYFGRPADKMKMIGVTGTNGKTTVTTLLKEIIESITGEKVGLIGTNQNMIGELVLPTERTTPESYELQELFAEMYKEGCLYVVMEVSSHSLALDRVETIEFEVGAFTNLTQDHLDFHRTMEEYLKAKAILFTKCKQGVVNLDDSASSYILEHAACPMLKLSTKKNEADLVAKEIRLKEDRVEFCLLMTGMLKKVRLNIPGMFSVYNALTVIACAMQLGFPVEEIISALSKCGNVKGRVEVVPTGKAYTVLIDYAHTPDAMENVLNTVKGFAKGRTIVLFGCGGDRDKTKRPKMGEIAVRLADVVVVTSDNPRTEDPNAIISDILEGIKGSKTPYYVVPDRKEAIRKAMSLAKPGDVVVLAGKGHENYQIIGKEKFHMDERELVASILEEEREAGK